MVTKLYKNLYFPLTESIGNIVDAGRSEPPQPIEYLTAWKLVGNSEVHGQEIWSCGEYNEVDGKYHILVQPLGGSIADIALDEPLRKVNDVADTIEFANGVATLTRKCGYVDLGNYAYAPTRSSTSGVYRYKTQTGVENIKTPPNGKTKINGLCAIYDIITGTEGYIPTKQGIGILPNDFAVYIYDENYNTNDVANQLKAHLQGVELIYELATPTTEVIQVPQIEEADSYSMVISQGAKAVEWSSFTTNSE